MGQVRLIVGPPGTGKTESMATWLAAQAGLYGSSKLLVCSYTKAAARAITKRLYERHQIEVPRDQIGTIHSLCYRALGSPKLTVGKEDEFQEAFRTFSLSKTSGSFMDDPFQDDRSSSTSKDDATRADYERYRAACVPESEWTPEAREFGHAWQDWKDSCGLFDFSDLLDICYRDVAEAPGGPVVGVLDEAQDSPKNQMRLFLKWTGSMQKAIVAGDPDQTLYRWCGADPQVLVDLATDGNWKPLSESHRVPVAVHAMAEAWIKRALCRIDRQYRPRQAPGLVVEVGASLGEDHNYLIDQALELADRQDPESRKRRPAVMFLASCSYMLNDLRDHLKRRGIPFGNEFRRRRRDWNPLHLSGETKGDSLHRLLAFLRPSPAGVYPKCGRLWSMGDCYLWMSWLAAEAALVRGAKKRLEEFKDSEEPFAPHRVVEMLSAQALAGFVDLDFETESGRRNAMAWWRRFLMPSNVKAIDYLLSVFQTRPDPLAEPAICLGTIHSVKGGEADHVYLSPDLSAAGAREWADIGPGQDSIRRTFYVGITRARESVRLCAPSGRNVYRPLLECMKG